MIIQEYKKYKVSGKFLKLINDLIRDFDLEKDTTKLAYNMGKLCYQYLIGESITEVE